MSGKPLSRVLLKTDIYLRRLLPAASSDLPEGDGQPPNVSSFGLASGGVYLAARFPERWCALAAPLHPYRNNSGGLFLWHFP